MSADRPYSSRFSPRSLVGVVADTMSNPEGKPASAAATSEQMLSTGTMLTNGDGASIMVDVNGTASAGRLLTDEPIFAGQRVWVSPAGSGVYGIHGAVR